MLAAARNSDGRGAAVAEGIGGLKRGKGSDKKLFVQIEKSGSPGSSHDGDAESENDSRLGLDLEPELLSGGDKTSDKLEHLLGVTIDVNKDMRQEYQKSLQYAQKYQDPTKKIKSVFNNIRFQRGVYPQNVVKYYDKLSYKHMKKEDVNKYIEMRLRTSVGDLQRFVPEASKQNHPQEIHRLFVNDEMRALFKRYRELYDYFKDLNTETGIVTLKNIIWDTLVSDIQTIGTAKETFMSIVARFESMRDTKQNYNDWLVKYKGESSGVDRVLNSMKTIQMILQHELLVRVKLKNNFYTGLLQKGEVLQQKLFHLQTSKGTDDDKKKGTWMRKISAFVNIILLPQVELMVEIAKANVEIPKVQNTELTVLLNYAKHVSTKVQRWKDTKSEKQSKRKTDPNGVTLLYRQTLSDLTPEINLFLLGNENVEELDSDYYSSSDEEEDKSPKPNGEGVAKVKLKPLKKIK
eukprot:93122-Rhodomonas_salina.1